MSLLVWLPLINDIHNQGISDLKINNTGVTFSNSGKIGGNAATFNGSAYLESNEEFGENITKWTIACWIKPNSTFTTKTQYGRIAGFGNHTRIQFDSGTNNYIRLFVSFNGSSSGNYDVVTSSTIIEPDTWYHLCGTVNDKELKLYVNGVLEATRNSANEYTSIPAGKAYIGKIYNGTNFYGEIQDFRIYENQVLSPLEVKKLSQGLVAHWPLSISGNENLIPNSYTRKSTDWINGSRVTIDEDESADGMTVVKLTGSSADWGCCTRTSQSATNYIPYISIKDKIVTFSCWIKANMNLINCPITFSLRTNSSASRTKYFTAGILHPTTEWQRMYITVEITDAKFVSGTGTISDTDRFFIEEYHHYDNQIVWTKGWKLELGNKMTPWMPNSVDDIYSNIGFDDGIEYDVSGFGYNGTKYGTFIYSTDTPKYNTSAVFDGTNHIVFGRILIRDELTYSWWAYVDDWAASSYGGAMMCSVEGGGMGHQIASNSPLFFLCGTGESSNSYGKGYVMPTPSAGWHMFTETWNGYSFKVYLDGQLMFTNDRYTTKTPIYYGSKNYVFIGGESGSSDIDPANHFIGKISDARIYATALSDEDILSLYNTPISLSANGALLTSGEYSEV